MYVASSADSEIYDKKMGRNERMNGHKEGSNAITESLMAMTGIADSPELIACVES
jgi:hypothetical protein